MDQTIDGILSPEAVLPHASHSIPAKPLIAPTGEMYFVLKPIPGYLTALRAATNTNSTRTLKRAMYHVYKRRDGMLNVTDDMEYPGSWINPADNTMEEKPKKPPLDPEIERRAASMAIHDISVPKDIYSTDTSLLEREYLHTTTVYDKIVLGYEKLLSLVK